MANSEKTIYEIPCAFNCSFCDDRVIEVRAYKGNEKCGLYGYARCGTPIRPPKMLAKKILVDTHSEPLHSAVSTMQTPQQPKTPETPDITCKVQEVVHSAVSTMQTEVKEVEKPKQEKDYFASLWEGE